ncbi:hypothetical protein AC249_AIPGENE6462, partial [Exaiptasia diaphana]
ILQHQAFVHIVKNTTQDHTVVVQIIRHTLKHLKEENPEIKTAYLRQDNAGCYHNATVLAACRLMKKETGIKVERVDFSDPQGGKGPCDRKAATIKAHVRRFLNEGNDIVTAENLKDAILSHGGVHGVRVALVDAKELKAAPLQDKWEGINSLNNFLYQDDDRNVTVWRAYDIGKGKTLTWSDLKVDSKIPDSPFKVSFSNGHFEGATKAPVEKPVEGKENESEDETEIPVQDNGLFSCPFEGCVKTFQRYSNLEHHMSYGKCQLKPEKRTLMDKAKVIYQQKLLEGASEQPLLAATSKNSPSVEAGKVEALSQGWALKVSKSGKRFNDNQKRYLDEKFTLGQDTGIKADPEQVAKDMRRAKTEDGKRRFRYDEFLSPQQIKSYFSRSFAKKKAGSMGRAENADEKACEDQIHYSSARDHILRECQIAHPIIYDTLNLCQMHEKDKLKKLSVALLRHICMFFEFEVESLSQSRKAPYLALISELVKGCTCGGKDK